MTTTHTPGPWTIEDGIRGFEIIATTEDGQVTIATVYDDVEGGEHNAHLIVTAPDMLAALKSCVVQYEAYVEASSSSGGDDRFHHKNIAAARNAIAKATEAR